MTDPDPNDVEPDAAQTPLLIAKLKAVFPPQDPAPFNTVAYATQMLTGIPIEEVAASLNKRYLYQASKVIHNTRILNEADWRPDNWAVVCPPYLFEGWERIDGVPVLHTCPLDWQVFLIRTFDVRDLDPILAETEQPPPGLTARHHNHDATAGCGLGCPLHPAAIDHEVESDKGNRCRAIVDKEWPGLGLRRGACGRQLDTHGVCPNRKSHLRTDDDDEETLPPVTGAQVARARTSRCDGCGQTRAVCRHGGSRCCDVCQHGASVD